MWQPPKQWRYQITTLCTVVCRDGIYFLLHLSHTTHAALCYMLSFWGNAIFPGHISRILNRLILSKQASLGSKSRGACFQDYNNAVRHFFRPFEKHAAIYCAMRKYRVASSQCNCLLGQVHTLACSQSLGSHVTDALLCEEAYYVPSAICIRQGWLPALEDRHMHDFRCVKPGPSLPLCHLLRWRTTWADFSRHCNCIKCKITS